MYTIEGNLINVAESQSKATKQFSTLEDVQQYAEELDGYIITDDDDEIIEEQDDSETIKKIGLDYLFPNRHDDDFDQDDMDPESFVKE